jgi:type IV secretion system protein VirB9
MINSETKFRSYIYTPSEVYGYIGHYYYQGYIEFGKGEGISTITIGNSNAWFVKQLGNRLFLKPVEDDANTNLTVITNKRVYQFQLMAKEAKGSNDEDLIFSVKFTYPEAKNKNIFQFGSASKVNSENPDLRDLSKYNFDYDATGVPTIIPSKMFDDGRFTYFQFSQNSVVPAIFSVDPSSGFESMVNYRVTKKYFVVERVSPQFSLRNGNDIACIYNNKEMRKRSGIESRKNPITTNPRSFQNPTNLIKKSPQSFSNPNIKSNRMTPPNMPMMPGIF